MPIGTVAWKTLNLSSPITVGIVALSLLSITLSVNLQVPLYKAYAEIAGYHNGLIAIIFAGYIVGLLPVFIFLGGISDYIGRKRAILASLLVSLLGNALFIAYPFIQMLFLVRVLQGVAIAMSLGSCTAYISELLKNSSLSANLSGFLVAIGLGGGSLLTSISLGDHFTLVPYSYYVVLSLVGVSTILMLILPDNQLVRSTKLIRFPHFTSATLKYSIAIFSAWSLTGIMLATIPGELTQLNLSTWGGGGWVAFLSIATGAMVQPLSRKIGSMGSLRIGYILLVLAYVLLLFGIFCNSIELILLASAFSGASSFGFIYLGGLSAVVETSDKNKARAVSGYFLFAYIGLGIPCIFIGFISESLGLFNAIIRFPLIVFALISSVYLTHYVTRTRHAQRGKGKKKYTGNHEMAVNTFTLSKADLIHKESQRMASSLISDSWTVRQKIALTCHILYSHGHGSGLSGQVTARYGNDAFLTQQLGYGLDEITVSNLLIVDEDLNVIEGTGMSNPANRFHAWIYKSRPDIHCIVHTHPLYTSALSMLEEPIKISHMDTFLLHEQIAFLAKWPGIPVGNEEGELISSALKEKNVLFLAHHGLITIASSIEEACLLAIQFERAAQLYILSSSIGAIKEVDSDNAMEARNWVLNKKRTEVTFSYYARQVLRKDNFCLQ